MEFIKKMKKREFIEMGLKTLAAVFAAFLAIILMEGMIYGIQLKALKNGTTATTMDDTTIAYCIKETEDKYFIVYQNPGYETEWFAIKNNLKTEEECQKLRVKEVVMGAPSAFVFSIENSHYIVMGVLIGGVLGFFAYKFVKLARDYKKIEDQFIKTGTIEI